MKKVKNFKNRGNRYSKTERREIVAARRRGLTYAQLAKKFGVSPPTVLGWVSK